MSAYLCEKYEGLGNDFLVVADQRRVTRYDEALIRHLCDRHTGIGADGLIRLSEPINKGAVRMELRNADGSFAETSGNGLRCAALAARNFGFVSASSFVIETEVSNAHADFIEEPQFGLATIRVTMGQIRIDEVRSPLQGFAAYRVDVGNPHLVLIGDNANDVDIETVGPCLETSDPDGLNVEVISLRTTDEIDLVVWERGAGITQACGSGSCAGAGAARQKGLVGSHVTVHNPGGALVVDLSGPDLAAPSAALTGPARRIGRIEIAEDELNDVLGDRLGATA